MVLSLLVSWQAPELWSRKYLVFRYGLPWTTSWVVASIGGYLVAMVCWLPAAESGTPTGVNSRWSR